jgi:uncharacterized protein YbcC (UPF0753/DUF2309 family)
MRFNVPVHVAIEASSPADARKNAEAIQALLNDPMVKNVLEAQGIRVTTIQVFQPQQR